MELLEVLDLDEDAGAFNRTEEVALTIKGKRSRVRLCTEGWETALEEWKVRNPKPLPPFTEEVIRTGDERARELGIKRGIHTIRVYDPQDANYLRAKEAWGSDSNFAIVAHCLKLELRKGGQAVTDNSERVAVLKELGLTSMQATMLARLVWMLSGEADVLDAEHFAGPSEAERR